MERVAFGGVSFDPEHRLLFRGREPVALGSRGTALLCLLVSRRGQVVSKDDLMDAAWPGRAVEESNLSVQITLLRKALGSTPAGGQWITTVARTGYRLMPEPVDAPFNEVATSHHPKVAVLPFVDFSGRPDTPLASYLLQDVVTALSRFRSLSVVSRSLGAQFPAGAADARTVARHLEVYYLVEGSFRRVGEQLRLSLQLIDGASGGTVWADDLHMPLIDGVGDTDELAGRAAASLDAHVHLAEIGRAHRGRPESMEAYDFFLRGRRRIQTSTETDNALALDLFFRALEFQPDNIEFLAGAAEAMHHRISVGWRPLPMATRKLTAELARRGLDRVAGDAASMGIFGDALLTSGEEDIGTILTARAVTMNRYSPLALVCDSLARVWNGEFDEAEKQFNQVVGLSAGEPTQRFAFAGLSLVATVREDWKSALHWAQVTHSITPGLSDGHTLRIAASAMLGQMDNARRYLGQFMAIAPGVSIRSIDDGQPYRNRSHLAPLLAALRLAGLPER